MQQRASFRNHRATATLLATVAISGLLGSIAHADQSVAIEPVTTAAVVAVGLPPIPPTTVVVAVGLPPVPPTIAPNDPQTIPPAIPPGTVVVAVAVGLPPVPPTVDVTGVASQSPVQRGLTRLPETGATIVKAATATVLSSVGAALAEISRRTL